MRQLNVLGLSRSFIPQVTVSPLLSMTHDGSHSCNVLFMSGEIPSVEVLKVLKTEDDINALPNKKLNVLNNIVLSFKYNLNAKRMEVKKTPVDALEVPFLESGTIEWCVIIFNTAGTDKYMLFLDTGSIGLWGDTNKLIIVDTLLGIKDEINIIKDISFNINDNFN